MRKRTGGTEVRANPCILDTSLWMNSDDSRGGQSFHIARFSRFLDLYGASERVVQEVRQKEGQVLPEQLGVLLSQPTVYRRTREAYAEQAVYSWLVDTYQDKDVRRDTDLINSLFEESPISPDFVVSNNHEDITAIDIIYAGQEPSTVVRREISYRGFHGHYAVNEGKISRFIFICY